MTEVQTLTTEELGYEEFSIASCAGKILPFAGNCASCQVMKAWWQGYREMNERNKANSNPYAAETPEFDAYEAGYQKGSLQEMLSEICEWQLPKFDLGCTACAESDAWWHGRKDAFNRQAYNNSYDCQSVQWQGYNSGYGCTAMRNSGIIVTDSGTHRCILKSQHGNGGRADDDCTLLYRPAQD